MEKMAHHEAYAMPSSIVINAFKLTWMVSLGQLRQEPNLAVKSDDHTTWELCNAEQASASGGASSTASGADVGSGGVSFVMEKMAHHEAYAMPSSIVINAFKLTWMVSLGQLRQEPNLAVKSDDHTTWELCNAEQASASGGASSTASAADVGSGGVSFIMEKMAHHEAYAMPSSIVINAFKLTWMVSLGQLRQEPNLAVKSDDHTTWELCNAEQASASGGASSTASAADVGSGGGSFVMEKMAHHEAYAMPSSIVINAFKLTWMVSLGQLRQEPNLAVKSDDHTTWELCNAEQASASGGASSTASAADVGSGGLTTTRNVRE